MDTLLMMAVVGLAIAYLAFPQFKARVDRAALCTFHFVKAQFERLRKK